MGFYTVIQTEHVNNMHIKHAKLCY